MLCAFASTHAITAEVGAVFRHTVYISITSFGAGIATSSAILVDACRKPRVGLCKAAFEASAVHAKVRVEISHGIGVRDYSEGR
jgi:hypothetical protein